MKPKSSKKATIITIVTDCIEPKELLNINLDLVEYLSKKGIESRISGNTYNNVDMLSFKNFSKGK